MKKNYDQLFSTSDMNSDLEILPPSVMPVIILRGSDYEMGYQYGQQACQYIEIIKNAKWAVTLKKFCFKYDKVIHELRALQYYIKKYVPGAIEEIKGIADGASVGAS